jgi:hypothetical protein
VAGQDNVVKNYIKLMDTKKIVRFFVPTICVKGSILSNFNKTAVEVDDGKEEYLQERLEKI